MGSEKSPPDDDDSVGGAGRSFLGGGGPKEPDPVFVDVCLPSSTWRREGFEDADLDPKEFLSSQTISGGYLQIHWGECLNVPRAKNSPVERCPEGKIDYNS